jgi:hypothetical protein
MVIAEPVKLQEVEKEKCKELYLKAHQALEDAERIRRMVKVLQGVSPPGS